MKKSASIVVALVGAIAIALAFVRASAPAAPATPRYTADMTFVGLGFFCVITDHVDNKLYLYDIKDKPAASKPHLELGMTIDLTKAGQSQIDVVMPATRPADAK